MSRCRSNWHWIGSSKLTSKTKQPTTKPPEMGVFFDLKNRARFARGKAPRQVAFITRLRSVIKIKNVKAATSRALLASLGGQSQRQKSTSPQAASILRGVNPSRSPTSKAERGVVVRERWWLVVGEGVPWGCRHPFHGTQSKTHTKVNSGGSKTVWPPLLRGATKFPRLMIKE